LFVLLVAVFTSGVIKLRNVFIAGLVGIVLLITGAWWSAIKIEYRTYLDQGSHLQTVLVGFEDRIAFLMNKLSQVDAETMRQGFERLAARVGYIDYLAATMRHVPSAVPFQQGAQIGATVLHILEPRLLFPDKPALEGDTDVLEKYTGLHFGKSSGTGSSVSMGYVAELYVDFGVLGAVAGTFIMGFLVGRIFRFVVSWQPLPVIVNYGLAMILMMTFTQFDESLIKLVGSFLTALGAVLVLRRFLLPYLLASLGLRFESKLVSAPAA
jgi:hypothetical protein